MKNITEFKKEIHSEISLSYNNNKNSRENQNGNNKEETNFEEKISEIDITLTRCMSKIQLNNSFM